MSSQTHFSDGSYLQLAPLSLRVLPSAARPHRVFLRTSWSGKSHLTAEGNLVLLHCGCDRTEGESAINSGLISARISALSGGDPERSTQS
ncbi:hypothetical protein CesoFtcFv8_000502 [Champsocephalus esox]|uniref:Uncharacterized protein n=1 Tax=Champsocephalus esox TaxID=159716 RepID=A0AAN8D1K6_9TELE|nr:hypothetical protein CesoFtcFv8_000502 [Champsocephalus esox]